jgi:hypothetical protein
MSDFRKEIQPIRALHSTDLCLISERRLAPK